jgi:2-aminoadipate transaminase
LTESSHLYAAATRRIKPSVVRELFAPLGNPDVISLAGDSPSEVALDMDGLLDATKRATARSPATAFQYGNSEGYMPLRELIAQRAVERGVKLNAQDMVVTTGSQQAIDLVTRVLVDPGDRVAVDAPTYLGTLQALQFHGADVVSVATDTEGIRTDELEAVVARHHPKMLYTIPNFANPTGNVLSLHRRKAILSLATKYRFFVVEDDAYGELYFREPPPPSLFSLANEEERRWVIHIASFSKSLAPGLRLAWMSAPPALRSHLVVAKQLGDTHTTMLSQLVAFHYLNAGSLEPALSRMRILYQRQAYAVQRAIKAELADTPFRADMPDGGMFYWAEIPGVDTGGMLKHAIQRGIAYVPGTPFYAGNPETSRLRLSFASASAERIAEGIRRLGDCIRFELERVAQRSVRKEQQS